MRYGMVKLGVPLARASSIYRPMHYMRLKMP